MELRQIRAFVLVAAAKHFGRAAAALKITQPALTQRIQALERELGVQLLTRSAREVTLTPAGEVLLPYANSLVRIEDHALRDLADNASGRAGKLRISYQLHSDSAVMGEIMAEFRRRYPEVEVQTGSAYSLANVEQIVAGEVDAAFVSMPVTHQDIVTVRRISDDEMLVAMGERHRLVEMERVPVEALAGEPMILFPIRLSPILAVAFRRWLTRHTGAELNIIAEEPHEQAAFQVAKSDRLVSFVSSRWSSIVPAPGLVYRSMIPTPMAGYGVAYRHDDESPQLANLLEIVDEITARSRTVPPEDGELFVPEEGRSRGRL
jgi:DNA-binding transcriptional LysR family regulator